MYDHKTIFIEGSKLFADEVADALKEICPCYEAEAVKAGRRSGKKFYKIKISRPDDADEFCECYCKHRAGCNLIKSLATTDGWNTWIRKVKGEGSKHNQGRIGWNPNRKWRRRPNGTKERRPPSVALAHELVHAHSFHSGNRARGLDEDTGIENEEINATRGENQIREEMMGDNPRVAHPRTDYDGKDIPNPTQKFLDDSDRENCDCDERGKDAGKDGGNDMDKGNGPE